MYTNNSYQTSDTELLSNRNTSMNNDNNSIIRPSYYGGQGSANKPIVVTINIYDLHYYNRYLHWLGLGAYHSGVVIFSNEYTYGLHPYNTTGVFCTPIRQAGGAVYRCNYTDNIHCKLTQDEFNDLLDNYLKPQFIGNEYNLLTRNCNVFTIELCKALGIKPPSYINRLAYIASYIQCILPKSLFDIVIPTDDVVDILEHENELTNQYIDSDDNDNDNINNTQHIQYKNSMIHDSDINLFIHDNEQRDILNLQHYQSPRQSYNNTNNNDTS